MTGLTAFSASALSTLTLGCDRMDKVNFPDYENNLRDRLWMWGHDSGAYDGPDGVYNIPLSSSISMVDAIKSMDIPNVCVIRGGDLPTKEYLKQFEEAKRFAWGMPYNDSSQAEKDFVFGLRETMPNLTGYFFDDFFTFGGTPEFDENSVDRFAPAHLSMEEMKQLNEEAVAYKRPLDLAVVLYTHQLDSSIQSVMKYFDTVSLWIWEGDEIQKIEENFKKYRSLVPDKPTLLGIYMWDFGGKRELDQAFMIKQLDFAHRLYTEGQIEGLIFHCTPLVNKNLKAVDYARDWIAKHGNDKR